MSAPALAFAGAAEWKRQFEDRTSSPTELARLHLERIVTLDPVLRAYITVTPDRAMDDARAAERALGQGRPSGPLAGVTLGLKDLIDTASLRTTAGSRILSEHVPGRDATVAERCRAGGLVLTGKHNLHEFAYGTTNNNIHYGACRNPWNLDYVAGGSSGGGAAAVAAGLCTLAIGTDTGGSIRIPASACGVVGLKPTLGRVSRRGVWPLAWSLDHVGPISRTVEDAARLLSLIAGHDPEDPWSAARPAEDFAASLDDGVRGLRIGVPREPPYGDLDPDVGAALEAALTVLGALGATPRDLKRIHGEHTYTAFHAILATEASAIHLPWLRSRPQDYDERTRQALEHGLFVSATDLVDARRYQHRVRAELDDLWVDVDVLVTATLPRTALPLGEPVSREPDQAWNRLLVPFNLAGLPAITIPCGFDRRGLPIGLQIVGRAFDEATVLRVARAYERETPWHLRRPAWPDESAG